MALPGPEVEDDGISSRNNLPQQLPTAGDPCQASSSAIPWRVECPGLSRRFAATPM
jgi:hypothetical protein